MSDAQKISQAQLGKILASMVGLDDKLADASFDSPFLRLMLVADRKKLVSSFSRRSCEPGEIIFYEGMMGDSMYVISAGRAAVVKGDLDAKTPAILAFRGAGDVIGEMAVLENRPRSASVVALEGMQLFGVNRREFQALLEDTPSVGMQIMGMLSARLRDSGEARVVDKRSERRLVEQVSSLKVERQRLQELERLRQETNDLIVHDLRNPISSIGIALKMLTVTLSEQVLEENKDLLAIAQSSSARLQRLVDSLLEIASLETGKTQFVWDEMDLGALLARLSESFDQKGKEVDLLVDIGPSLPKVVADQEKISQVLAHLLDNAFSITPLGGAVRLAVDLAGKDVLAVSVADSGPTLSEERRRSAFDRFSQAMGAGGGDFGLGLAFCRLTVEAHGGRIWVEPSPQGPGNRFVFTLPLGSSQE